MKRITSLILVAFMLLSLTACGGSTNTAAETDPNAPQNNQTVEDTHPDIGNQDSASTVDTALNDDEENGMKEILEPLIGKNYDCITQLFYYGHLPYKTDSVDDVNHTAVVNSEQFASLNDIKWYLSSIYIEEEVDRLLNDYYESKPLYYEQDGTLRINLDQASNAGLPAEWKKYTIDTVNVDGNVCRFTVQVEYDVDELYVGDSIETFEFEALNSDGWKLVKAVYMPM